MTVSDDFTHEAEAIDEVAKAPIAPVDQDEVIEARQELAGSISAPQPRRSLGLWADAWRRLRRNKLALVGLAIITVFMTVGLAEEVASIAGVHLSPYNQNAVNYDQSPQGIGASHSW